MKKEARQEAQSIFLDADGKITNTEIAKKLDVSSSTVAKWKKAEAWATKLTAKSEKREEKAGSKAARMKGARDQALKLYLEAEGKITNKVLAGKVGVSPNSIVNWKGTGRWAEILTKSKEPLPPKPVPTEEPITTPQVPVTEKAEEIEIDLENLTCPDHITRLNERIDHVLSQEYLSLTDLKTLAEAKEAVLGIVSAYIDIIERCSED